MCHIKQLSIFLNVLQILGTILVFFNSPFVDSRTYAYRSMEADSENKKGERVKRKRAKVGFALIIFGNLCQMLIISFE